MDKKYIDIAGRIIENNLRIKPSEKVVIVSDDQTENFGRAFFKACQEQGLNSILMLMPITRTDGAEPPDTLGQAMQKADVIIAVTKFTLTHGKATKLALENGARVLSIPGINERIFFSKAMEGSVDMVRNTLRISELLSAGLSGRLVTEAGTDLKFELGGWDRVGGADTGEIEEPGLLANLPAGESLISPVEGTVNGTAVIDASVSGGIGILTNKVILEIESGKVVSIKGGDEAQKLQQILEKSDENAFNLAEIAFGINPHAEVIGNIIIDEKTVGTAHLGIGNSKMLGGTVYSNVHLDAVFYGPQLEVDGHLIIEGEKFHTGPAPWEDLSFSDYAQVKDGKFRLTGEYEINSSGYLLKKWKDVMGRSHSTLVGNEEASLKCARAVQNLDKQVLSLQDLAHTSGLDIQEVGRVANMLQRYKLLEIVS